MISSLADSLGWQGGTLLDFFVQIGSFSMILKPTSTERFIEKLGANVYPITILKFLLNKKRIISYFSKAADKNFQIRVKYNLDHSDCENCAEKASEGMLCRQHTSIDRVMTADSVAYDVDTNTYFFRNEIYRMVGNRLVIVYCPHPKLISGEITDQKVRKVNPITIEDDTLHAKYFEELYKNKNVQEFLSTDLLDRNMSCWFNKEFTIVTVPNGNYGSNWCLIANQ
jgi:hypothetical protein